MITYHFLSPILLDSVTVAYAFMSYGEHCMLLVVVIGLSIRVLEIVISWVQLSGGNCLVVWNAC